MKKIISIVLVLSLMFAAAGCGSTTNENPDPAPAPGNSDNEYEKLELRLSTSGSDQDTDAITARHFAELVEEASGGNIKITVFPNSQLAGGSQPKNIEMLAMGGNFELAFFSGSVLGNIDERFLTHQIPFIFEDYATVNKYHDSTGGEFYAKMLEEKGLVYLDSHHNGFRQLTNSKHEVTKPEDLKGMKIRVPNGEVYIKTLGAFGADPVAMNWSEVFTALQQGTIDGHENSFKTIDASKIYEIQDYVTEWNWSYDGYWILSNQKDWNKFSDATKELLMEKAHEAATLSRKEFEEAEGGFKDKFIESGTKVNTLTEEQRAEFVEIARPIQEYFIEKFGADVCSAWGLE